MRQTAITCQLHQPHDCFFFIELLFQCVVLFNKNLNETSHFLLPLVCTCRALTVSSFEGQDVTLPCKYNWGYHGKCDICWMKGSIPNNGCGTQIIYANSDGAVVSRADLRYQLKGALKKGDASLTILKARKSDSGKYGCRVHVPGWFNDIKIEVYLQIREGKYSLLDHRNRTFLHVSYLVFCFIVTFFFSTTPDLHHSAICNYYDTHCYTQ